MPNTLGPFTHISTHETIQVNRNGNKIEIVNMSRAVNKNGFISFKITEDGIPSISMIDNGNTLGNGEFLLYCLTQFFPNAKYIDAPDIITNMVIKKFYLKWGFRPYLSSPEKMDELKNYLELQADPESPQSEKKYICVSILDKFKKSTKNWYTFLSKYFSRQFSNIPENDPLYNFDWFSTYVWTTHIDSVLKNNLWNGVSRNYKRGVPIENQLQT